MIASLPGVDLFFNDSGGDGAPLVLMHANTGNADSWEMQTRPFAAAGFRVIAFDRRGWARSVPRPDTGPQPGSIAEDLDALARHVALPRFHLLGVAGGIIWCIGTLATERPFQYGCLVALGHALRQFDRRLPDWCVRWRVSASP